MYKQLQDHKQNLKQLKRLLSIRQRRLPVRKHTENTGVLLDSLPKPKSAGQARVSPQKSGLLVRFRRERGSK